MEREEQAELGEVDPALAEVLRRARNAAADLVQAEEEARGRQRLSVPDRPMSGREVQRLRRRNDNRERWDRGLL